MELVSLSDYIFLILKILLVIGFIEVVFLVSYRLKNGVPYFFVKKIPLKKFHIIPHPYIPFIYKKGIITPEKRKDFPNYRNYLFPSVKINNLQFVNGENGDRDVVIPKPKDLTRVNCLGASVTSNYVRENDKNFSYPMELERILKSKYQNKNIEVNNCAQGGYNSADILVRTALSILDTQPDYVTIHHGFNDVRSYLTDDFKSDYSHSRNNLGDNFWKFYFSSLLPDIPLNFYNYLKNKILPSPNIRHALLDVIAKGKENINADYKVGLKTFERNIKSIISLFKSVNTKVILCTYTYHLFDNLKKDKVQNLYSEIVKKENEIIRKLALEFNIDLVDADKIIEKTKENFVDSMHYSKSGMTILAKAISQKINL